MGVKDLVRKYVRNFVPQRARSWYRERRYQQSRSNVVLLLEDDDRVVNRWLRSTPDTYRIDRIKGSDALPSFDELADDSGDHPTLVIGADDEENLRAVKGLLAIGTDVAVVGATKRPVPSVLGPAEPLVAPTAVALSRETLEEVGGPIAKEDPITLYLRTRETGREMALMPRVSRRVSQPHRRDVIKTKVVVIVAAVPMHDVGGGSRAAQLAQEMLIAGMHVIYISLFPSYETVDLGLRFVHPQLEQYRLREVSPPLLARRPASPGWVLLEVPHPEGVRLADELRDEGWRLCYDITDRWTDPALGGDWYEREWELRVVQTADLVAASAQDLANRAGEAGVEVVLIPNAVNTQAFGRTMGASPKDLPAGEGPLFGYHGSFYGDWFDWGAVNAVATEYPQARLVMIGDVSRGHPPMPGNVHFLGLKTQRSLPEYVARFDVGLLPFVISETTHAVSPLKVYEYLASGVPVAAPPLRPLEGLPGVYSAISLPMAVREALDAPDPDPGPILGSHGWANRVDQLLDGMGLERDHSEGRPPLRAFERPVKHYQLEERLFG